MNKQNYGYQFNNIIINEEEVIKEFKNTYGKIKINNEINFYKFIKTKNIKFPVPKILNISDGKIIIEFIKNSVILTNVVTKKNINIFIKNIKKIINILHDNKINIDNKIILEDVRIEIFDKILNRYNNFLWSENLIFKSISSINGIKFKNINYYCQEINKKIFELIKDRKYYNLIHGDIHLGNMLINDKKEIFFIDPRGYFGNTKLFGIKEYDLAKLLFGLSGYSVFDLMEIEKLEIKERNLQILFIKDYENIFESKEFDNLTKLLTLSIWLGNNSCFGDENKKITSLMIAFYYCEKYLSKF